MPPNRKKKRVTAAKNRSPWPSRGELKTRGKRAEKEEGRGPYKKKAATFCKRRACRKITFNKKGDLCRKGTSRMPGERGIHSSAGSSPKKKKRRKNVGPSTCGNKREGFRVKSLSEKAGRGRVLDF